MSGPVMRFLPVPLQSLVLSLILAACGRSGSPPVSVPAEFQTALAGSVLYAGDSQAAAGVLDLSVQGAISIRPVPPVPVPPLASLELEYSLRNFSGAADWPGPVLSYTDSGTTTGSFVLPLPDWDPANQDPANGDPANRDPESSGGPPLIRYAVPLLGDSLESLRIDVPTAESRAPGSPILELKSLDIVQRWYGVERDGRGLRISPFVFTDPQGSIGIETPEDFAFPGGADLLIRAGGSVRWTVGNRRFEKLAGGEGFVPAGFF
ncbi:MAG: hypothetical protein LBL56_08115, partial [Treponema sp.]|nr:hypothetical protein [Treponema sp.]